MRVLGLSILDEALGSTLRSGLIEARELK